MTPEQSVRAEHCATEKMALELRRDLQGVDISTPWLSHEERYRYRQAALNFFRRLYRPDRTATDSLIHKLRVETLHGASTMVRLRASAVNCRPESWDGQVAFQLGKLADDIDRLA
jgi:hypothetical protein